MNTDKKLMFAALAIGFLIGLVVGIACSNRYQLKDGGMQGVVYKLDTWTGETWLVYGNTQTPVQSK
ncbi:MAG: hypothetical protein WBW41_17700 [Verrucomicrobiia bacterium]